MNTEDQSRPAWEDRLRKASPGLLVMLSVLILVKGVGGTCAALWLQATTLVESFFGGGDAMAVVMLHTTPLAIAAAIATFSIARGWLAFESFQSVIALALIVLAGASLGGTLRQWAPSTPSEQVSSRIGPGNSAPPTDSPRARSAPIDPRPATDLETAPVELVVGHPGKPPAPSRGIPLAIGESRTWEGNASPRAVPNEAPTSPWGQLAETKWWDAPNLKHPPKQIQPLKVIPEPGGVLTLIAKAINMLLGYLVGYQPRLFLAAILVGGWTGWKWHQKLAEWEQRAVRGP